MAEPEVDRLFRALYSRMQSLNATMLSGKRKSAPQPSSNPFSVLDDGEPVAEPERPVPQMEPVDEGEGEWTEQRSKRRGPPKSDVVQIRPLISEKELAVLITLMQHYWLAYTGRHFNFRFTRQSQPYLSPPKHTFARNARMQLTCDKPPEVLEIGVGSGGELFTTLFQMAAASTVALEPALEEFEGRDVFRVLTANVNEFYKTFPELDRSRLQIIQKTAKEYFESIPPGPPGRKWDYVTLDPPFALPVAKENESEKRLHESDLRQCMEWAYHEVLFPMVQRGHTARLFVIKSRYPSHRVSQEWARIAEAHRVEHNNDVLMNMTFYDAMPCCPYNVKVDTDRVNRGEATKGVFFWVFFAFLEERINVIRNDPMWNAVVVDHDQDVYVRAEDFVQPVVEYPYGRNVGSTRFQYTPLDGHPGVKISRVRNWRLDPLHLPKGEDRPHPEQDDLYDALHNFGKYERVVRPSSYPRGVPMPKQNPVDFDNPFNALPVDGVEA